MNQNPLFNIASKYLPKTEESGETETAPVPGPALPKLPGFGGPSINPMSGMMPSPFGAGPSFSPTAHKSSAYTVSFSPEDQISKELQEIANKRVEDMSQEELRKVYLSIGAPMGKRLYSASTIKFIADRNRFPGENDFKFSDSLFIGDQVHKAMETNGENLSKLKTYAELGDPPAKPDFGFADGHNRMIDIIACGGTREDAVMEVRNNKVTKAVTPEMMQAFRAWEVGYEAPKEIIALQKEAIKETAIIDYDAIGEYRKYLGLVGLYNKRKAMIAKAGDIIVDDLPFRKMGAQRMIYAITETYNALTSSREIMEVYQRGYTGKGELHTEYVILWKHTLSNGVEVRCKSMMDRYILDYESKVATVSDIKTHSGGAREFIGGNYRNYKYYQAMSFYKAAVEWDLTQRGEDPTSWTIHMALLPASTAFREVGCDFPVMKLSEMDIYAGKYGGFMKPMGTKYNQLGEAQIFMDGTMYQALNELGLVHEYSRDLYRKGWEAVIFDFENSQHAPIL
jgi:hypothetical protein